MCGLVKNMLFTLGEVTVLLQVEKTLYQILLRRYFNTNTKSQVVNDKKGDQTINITCSNTGIEVVLWQPLDTQGLMISLTSKPQSRDIMWDIHKRTRQGASS